MMSKKLLALSMVVALAGCSRSEPETPLEENTAVVQPVEPAPTAEVTPSPTATPTPAAAENASAELPPAEEVAPDEQMLDDAATTGMTARARRDEQAEEAETTAGNREER